MPIGAAMQPTLHCLGCGRQAAQLQLHVHVHGSHGVCCEVLRAAEPDSGAEKEGPTKHACDCICASAASSEAMLKWLRSPALPRYFVLDLLDYVLANTPAIFR